MGTCCETSRKNGSDVQNLFTKGSIRSKIVQKKTKESRRSFQITENSFHNLQKDSLCLLYRRESESLEYKYLYSTIYQATHTSSSTPALIREVKKTIVRKRLNTEAFFESISMQKELDHPNIAKIFELYQDEDYYYLIYENIKGSFLSDYIGENRYLAENETALVGRKVASIIQFLHTKDIVNGLICPGNLIFGLDQRIETIKLFDFSFATRLRGEGKKLEIPLPNKFRAPELSAEYGYTNSSEIWAFGALLHTMLHGQDRNNLSEDHATAFEETDTVKFRFRSSRNITPQMKALIQGCVAKDPEKRLKLCDLMRYSALNKVCIGNRKFVPETSVGFRFPQDKGKLHQLILRFIINRILKHSEKLPFMSLFESLDTNNDGSISKAEFLAKYYKLRNDPIRAQREADCLFRSLNTDHTHQITFSEFLSITMNRRLVLTRQNVNAVFKLFDLSNSGCLTKENLSLQLGLSNTSDEDWNEFFQNAYSNNCSEISIQKFQDLLCEEP